MKDKPDPRLNAWRADLAAGELRGQVDAPRYADGRSCHITAASAPLRREPRSDAMLETETLFGETVTVYDEQEGWAWVQLQQDRYVGYLPSVALGEGAGSPTHRITALRTYVFPAPGIKLPPMSLLSINSLVEVAGAEGGFLTLSSGGCIPAVHAAPVDERAQDFVAVAERFLGAPYLWGGRSSLGLDCSALVQLSLQAAGIACPRDTDMQERALGKRVEVAPDLTGLRRGDLVFWKGHVGIMSDADTLLHANAFHMETSKEPLAAAVKRIAAGGQDVSAIRRL